MAMTAHPTVTVVKIATKGTSESPELDHLDPVKRSNVKTLYKQTKSSIFQISISGFVNMRIKTYYKYLHECIEEVQGESSNPWNGISKTKYFSFGSRDGIDI